MCVVPVIVGFKGLSSVVESKNTSVTIKGAEATCMDSVTKMKNNLE